LLKLYSSNVQDNTNKQTNKQTTLQKPNNTNQSSLTMIMSVITKLAIYMQVIAYKEKKICKLVNKISIQNKQTVIKKLIIIGCAFQVCSSWNTLGNDLHT